MPALTSNTLTRQVDLPTWEWTRFAPAVSSALSSTCAAENANFYQEEHGRYIYYYISLTQFFRYDTWTDMYQQLSSPTLGSTFTSMKYNSSLGIEDKVLGTSSNTITVAAVTQQSLVGYDVVIVSGTGAGQRRIITAAAEPAIADSGIVTAISNTLGSISITDSTKTWAVNQWAGYTLRTTGNTGVSQVRRILSNSATVIVLGDTLQMNKPFNNPAIFAPAINATAGSQANYAIESQVITVDSNWTIVPDSTSVYRIQSGLIYVVSNNPSVTPFFTLQAYDVLTDTWYVLPCNQQVFSASGTDISIERTSESASIWFRGKATGGSSTTLIDSGLGIDRAAWTTNQWVNYWVYIFSGTGVGQIRQITGNTTTTLTWASSGTAPDSTSRYLILGFDAGIATSGASTTITDSTKSWSVNRWANYAVRILDGTGAGQVRPIVSNTATVITIVGSWTTNPDSTSVYAIQGDPDKFYIQLGGIAALGIHNSDSMVTSFGRQQDFGIARSASATVAGHQPIAITSVSNSTTTATVTTVHNHQFKVGNLVTVRGASDANYNVTNVSIATVPSATTFTYTMAGTPASNTITNSNSTTVLQDVTKNWTTNQWAGFMLYMYTAAVTASTGSVGGQVARITSNTATTLTLVVAGTAPTNGVSRYSICTSTAIGAADFGLATGGSTTTVIDSGKNWTTNQWAGKRCRILTTTGVVQEVTISSNTSTTLTVSTMGGTPTNGQTGYAILEQTVKSTGLSTNWAFGTSDANYKGRYIFMVRGGGVVGFDRLDITTDRFNLIYTTPLTETLTTGTNTAYDGQDLLFFHKDATQRIMSLNVVTGKINGGSMYPYTVPTAIIGNRMEIFTTKDGLKYMWINRASFQECFRCLIFW